MRKWQRIPWELVGGLVLGFTLGLVYSWLISPVQYVNASPDVLRSDFKEQYRILISKTFQLDGNLSIAQGRLATLGDADPASALMDQASTLLAQGDPEGGAYSLLLLAQALSPATPSMSLPMETITEMPVATPTTLPAERFPPSNGSETPVTSAGMSEPTSTLFYTSTPRPSRTPIPTLSAPYVRTGQQEICDPNQLGVLLQVVAMNAANQPVPGAEIIISWSGGHEHIYTGLKPELGDGYADFSMTPGMLYSVEMASGSERVENLKAPDCSSGGTNWWGSLRLIFQQP